MYSSDKYSFPEIWYTLKTFGVLFCWKKCLQKKKKINKTYDKTKTKFKCEIIFRLGLKQIENIF